MFTLNTFNWSYSAITLQQSDGNLGSFPKQRLVIGPKTVQNWRQLDLFLKSGGQTKRKERYI